MSAPESKQIAETRQAKRFQAIVEQIQKYIPVGTEFVLVLAEENSTGIGVYGNLSPTSKHAKGAAKVLAKFSGLELNTEVDETWSDE